MRKQYYQKKEKHTQWLCIWRKEYCYGWSGGSKDGSGVCETGEACIDQTSTACQIMGYGPYSYTIREASCHHQPTTEIVVLNLHFVELCGKRLCHRD